MMSELASLDARPCPVFRAAMATTTVGSCSRRAGQVGILCSLQPLLGMDVRPHVAQNTNGRRSAIDKRTTRHPAMPPVSAAANASRKRSDWIKGAGGLRQTKLRGLAKLIGHSPLWQPPTIWCGYRS
jgi:hypothetical protein